MRIGPRGMDGGRYGLMGLAALELLVCAALTLQSPPASAQALDPAQIDRIEQAQEAFSDASANRPIRKATLTGLVRPAEGERFTSPIQVIAISRSGISRYHQSVALTPEGAFSEQVIAGVVQLYAQGEGYAPALHDRITLSADGPVAPPVELVLGRGHTVTLRLVDPQGAAVAGVAVSVHQPVDGVSLGARMLSSDAEGYLQIPNCALSLPVVVAIKAAGFPDTTRPFTFATDQLEQTWTIQRAAVSQGMVRSITGEPVAGAEIHLSGDDPRINPALLTRTDEQGRYTLDTLDNQKRYWLFVRAAGHGPVVVGHVRAGEADRTITLRPPLSITGTLTGDLDRLSKSSAGRRGFHYRNSIPVGEHSTYSSMLWADVAIENGIGTFRIDDLLPGKTTLELPDRHRPFQLTDQAIEDLRIDILRREASSPSPNTPDSPTRTVILRFKLPPNAIPIRGALRVWQSDPMGGGRSVDVVLKENEARWEAPTGGRINYTGHELAGWWIEREAHPITAGDGPLELETTARPAGAILVKVRGMDGTPATASSVNLLTIERPDDLKPGEGRIVTWPSPTIRQGADPGRFLISPVPLGGRYRVLASAGTSHVISDELTIDANEPLPAIELRQVVGVPVTGRVIDPNGQPVRGIPLRLKYDTGHGFSTAAAQRMTGPAGAFTFENVNPELDGQYTLEIQPDSTYQPMSVLIAPGEPIEIRLKAGLALAATIVDEAGKPVADRRVTLLREDGHAIETMTDVRGRFELTTLLPGRYIIRPFNCYPPGTNITRLDGGAISIRGGGIDAYPALQAGDPEPQPLRFIVLP